MSLRKPTSETPSERPGSCPIGGAEDHANAGPEATVARPLLRGKGRRRDHEHRGKANEDAGGPTLGIFPAYKKGGMRYSSLYFARQSESVTFRLNWLQNRA
jgi:hypothetical protein